MKTGNAGFYIPVIVKLLNAIFVIKHLWKNHNSSNTEKLSIQKRSKHVKIMNAFIRMNVGSGMNMKIQKLKI